MIWHLRYGDRNSFLLQAMQIEIIQVHIAVLNRTFQNIACGVYKWVRGTLNLEQIWVCTHCVVAKISSTLGEIVL